MHRKLILSALLVLFSTSLAIAQATQPTSDPALANLGRLRDAIKATYNNGDIEKMLTYLHPDVLIIFPDGQTLIGREALRKYYDRMLKGPLPIVSKYTADPVVDGRQLRGDVDLSYGRMNDQYKLTDGTEFGLDSRFTVTLVQLSDGPTDTGGWVIRSFHSSTDAFDNAVLKIAVKRTFSYGLLAGGAIGLILGGAIGWWLRNKRFSKRPVART